VVSQSSCAASLGRRTSASDCFLMNNLRHGKARLRAPEAVGRLRDFVQIDSQETERVWTRTEQNLPAATDAARTRWELQDPKHVAVIKDAIALHFA
jgi:hypothetical protein